MRRQQLKELVAVMAITLIVGGNVILATYSTVYDKHFMHRNLKNATKRPIERGTGTAGPGRTVGPAATPTRFAANQ